MHDLVAAGFATHPKVGRMLAGAVRSGKIAHAYLFIGPTGVGKREAALAFGRLAGCHEPTERDGVLAPCGICPSCERPYASDRHHDLMVIDPQQKESRISMEGSASGKEVPLIDRLRAAQEYVSIRPIASRTKCLAVLALDLLQDVHMNAILKTVEEPPAHALVLLTASNASGVLPTILSRCQRMDLPPAPVEAIVTALGRSDGAARRAALLSGGRLTVARRLLDAPELPEIEEGFRTLCHMALSDDPLQALRAAELCRSLCLQWYEVLNRDEGEEGGTEEERVRRSIEAVLFPLEAAIRDAYSHSLGAPEASLLDLGDRIATPSPGRAAAALGRIGEAKRAIKGNANTRLALEALFLAL